METTTLLDGVFYDSQMKGKEFLLFLDVDRLLAPCYEAVSQAPKKPRYGGWEATQIAGHSIGHWLSASSAMYQATKDKKLKDKLDYVTNELEHIQQFDAEGYLSGFPRACFDEVFSGDFRVDHFSLGGSWVPWYSIHKIFAGLIDTYNVTGNKTAFKIVIQLANWAKRGLDKLTDEQFQRMLICEHGGMNEVMADIYLLTENQAYLELAERFCHRAILQPLAEGNDELEGKHANTQIPKVIGAAKLYEITGNEEYRQAALFFWEQVVHHRSYAIGGNSIREHFGAEGSEELGIMTTETCNTYNMLKLTGHLFHWSHEARYMDYYEKALYNHILASQDPDSGMKTYFVSTQPGHFKVYCSPEESFWCCTGSGMENPARYTKHIYYMDHEQLYVNLFIPSQMKVPGKHIIITQETSFPVTEKSRLVFKKAKGEPLTLHIRVPYWLSGAIKATVNGETIDAFEEKGYLVIRGNWLKGDCIEIDLPMNLQPYQAKDDPKKSVIMYGPVVLAGAMGRVNFPETDILDDHLALNNYPLIDVPVLVADEQMEEWVKRTDDTSLVFQTEPIGQPNHAEITLVPFYELHHQRYSIYWYLMNEEEYLHFKDEEKEKKEKLRRITVDEVQPNEQQPEVEHHLKKENSYSGYLNTVHSGWRDSRGDGFFSYEMKTDPQKTMYLLVTYFGSDDTLHVDGKSYERDFDIMIDHQRIARQQLKSNKPGQLFDVCYEIPFELTQDKENVTVTFKSNEGTAAGGVYGVRIINEEATFH
ncbi:glycoside hydrolase family 127 protein [Bacillus atrophaeus]|uniref:beta-L-arabinofuranosidase domain-containing protein n=1 Tax=Bacillus atrophaeus TaxID=1452 RepID=UPI0028F6D934|nr:beta-L-arabinofuranosidase domain-containing protein [Bacillus atrophaeus]WNV79364.1 glycoside hydrolase family 127 protein [Bacillus atrophaeus]